jgi:polyhydroxyalkanoate synthesis regulator phasin
MSDIFTYEQKREIQKMIENETSSLNTKVRQLRSEVDSLKREVRQIK